MKQALLTLTVLGLYLICAGQAPPTQRDFDLRRLLEASDVVVAGTIVSVSQSGNFAQANGIRLDGVMTVDEELKGPGNLGSEIRFSFYYPQNGLPYRGVLPNTFRIVALKNTSGRYTFTNPYFPALVALPGTTVRKNDLVETILEALRRVLSSPSASYEEKSMALARVSDTPGETSVKILEELLANENSLLEFRLNSAATLCMRGNSKGALYAEKFLLDGKREGPSYARENLAASVTKLARPEFLPLLARLMKSPEVLTRRSAALAIFDLKSVTGIQPLAGGLNDPDFQVRYLAVIGLADLTGDSEWRPSSDDFKTGEAKYVAYWRAWAAAHVNDSSAPRKAPPP